MMRCLLPLVLLCGGALSAAPVKWHLSQVTFSDGGRAVGWFVYDADTSSVSSINIQTTPGGATTSAASAIAGGDYRLAFSVPPNLSVLTGPVGESATRILSLQPSAPLTGAGGTIPLTIGSVEGLCNASCTGLQGGTPSRSITGGALVAVSSNAPKTWYLSGTFDDGGQIVGQFDVDASGAVTSVDVATTAGTKLTGSARLLNLRTGTAMPQPILQSTPVAQSGSRVLQLAFGALAGDGTRPMLPGQTLEGICPAGSPPACPLDSANPRTLLNGVATTVRPPNYVRVISHIADGGGWQSAFIITNLTGRPVPYAVSFTQTDGMPLNVSGIGNFAAATLAPRGVAFLTSAGAGNLVTGWGRLIGGNDLSVTTTFIWKNANPGGDQQGSVPGDAEGDTSIAVPFDDTGGALSGVAVANTSPSPVSVLAVAYDEAGRILAVDSSIVLTGYGQTSFIFAQRPGFAPLANRKGLLRLFAIHGGQPPYTGLNGLLLKFLPNGAFTTINVANQ